MRRTKVRTTTPYDPAARIFQLSRKWPGAPSLGGQRLRTHQGGNSARPFQVTCCHIQPRSPQKWLVHSRLHNSNNFVSNFLKGLIKNTYCLYNEDLEHGCANRNR